MTDVEQATAKVNQLTDKYVRIVYLPPAMVAAAHYIGSEPERRTVDYQYNDSWRILNAKQT